MPGLAPFRNTCECVVLEIENRAFSLRSGVLLDPERRVVYSDTEPAAAVTRFRRHVSRRVRHLPGTVAYLSNLWVDNYYHWMQLTLPLLRFYRDVWPGSEIDYFYVGNSSLGRVQEETLALLGIDPSQIIRDPCTADRIVSAVYVHHPQHSPGLRYRDGWGHRFTRDLFGDLRESGHSPRIYVERGLVRNRRLKNEADLLTFLASRGFERVRMDGMSVADQARVFANAEVIVGLHGAALTNLVFASAGTKVVEMFPSDHIEASYFTAATHSELEYFYLLGEPGPATNQDLAISTAKIANSSMCSQSKPGRHR